MMQPIRNLSNCEMPHPIPCAHGIDNPGCFQNTLGADLEKRCCQDIGGSIRMNVR